MKHADTVKFTSSMTSQHGGALSDGNEEDKHTDSCISIVSLKDAAGIQVEKQKSTITANLTLGVDLFVSQLEFK